MHPNPIYRKTDAARSLRFARDRGFGVLALSTQGAPLLSHVPFLLAEDGSHALLHLVRSNPICRAADGGAAARLDVTGPDAYISPDWYGMEDQVPTWNYVAVALIGVLRPLPPEQLEQVLAAQSAAYETRLLPKTPWTMDKMSDEAKARFMRMILPYRLDIEDLHSTWKLGQNKPDAVRKRAAGHVPAGLGAERDALAQLMADPPEDG